MASFPIPEGSRSSIHERSSPPSSLSHSTPVDKSGLRVANGPQRPRHSSNPLDSPNVPNLQILASAHTTDHSSKILAVAPRYDEGHQRYETFDTVTPSAGSSQLNPKSFVDVDHQTSSDPVFFENFAWRISSGYFAYFICGWGDGVTATILPHLMSDFNITFMTGSLFYAASTIGFLTGTLLLEKTISQLGRVQRLKNHSAWVPHLQIFSRLSKPNSIRFSSLQALHLGVMSSSILHGMYFLIMGTRRGFPAIFMAYAIAAFARAILTGALNPYFAIVPKHIGYSYALWSFGSVISPLVCQAVMARGVPWFHFFYGSLVGSALNVTFLTISFRPTALEFKSEHRAADRRSSVVSLSPTITKHEDELIIKVPSTLRLALSQPFQWAISMFAAVYYASETTSQGFMVSYLLQVRHGNPNTVGYVTSGFFAGLMIGRLIWGYFTERLTAIQRKYVIEACILISLVMHFLIWFVPSVPVDSLALAVIGLFYGPIFPACLTLANDMLPKEICMVSMALISTTASIGSAIFPFVTGIILNQQGAHTLPYTNVALTGLLACSWVCLPARKSAPSSNLNV